MVIAPASTGRDSKRRNAVIRIDQTNSGIRCSVIPGARMLKLVVIILMEPTIEDAPERGIARIAMSTAASGCPMVDHGGLRVQPATGGWLNRNEQGSSAATRR